MRSLCNSKFLFLPEGLLCCLLLCASANASITGTVFNDYDQDGIRGPGELGVYGVEVRAYDSSNVASGPVLTDTNGQYSLPLAAGDYRVEFVLPLTLAHFRSSVRLSGSENTSVLFASDGASNVDYAVHVPADFCTTNPELVTTCFVGGPHDDASAGPSNEGTDELGAIVIFSKNGAVSGRNEYLENIDMVGATWGLAVKAEPTGGDALVFAAAYMKRLTDYGPGFDADGGGISLAERAGTIYVMSAGNRGVAATVLDHIVIPNASNGVPRAGGPPGASPPEPLVNWDRDSSSYAAVGKESLGDIDISEDGSTLWAVNLANKHLYQVDLTGGVGSFGTPVDLGAIPGPGCPGGDAGDWRPFALTYHHGALYVGGVCTGETNNSDPVKRQLNQGGSGEVSNWRSILFGTDNIGEVSAHVLRVTSALPGATSSLVVSQVFSHDDLSFNRGSAGLFSTAIAGLGKMPGRWYAWTSAFDKELFYIDSNTFRYTAHYPQPLLADLEFDRDGSLILGFRDRFSDQMGEFAGNPGNGGLNDPKDPYGGNCGPHSGSCTESVDLPVVPDGDFFWTTNTQGDTNRACWLPNPAGTQVYDGEPGDWEFESVGGNCPTNGRSPGELDPADYIGPPGNFPGLTTNEWYTGDGESFFGAGVHQERSLGGLATSPILGEVVVSVMDPSRANTGGVSYLSNSTGAETGTYEIYFGAGSNDGGLFGKGAGAGDVELLCAVAPIEIGNRVWVDGGATAGVQDPGEANVPDGVVVYLYDSTNTLIGQATVSNGRYYFGGASNSNMLGLNVLSPGQTYTIAIDPADPLLAGYSLTTPNATSGAGSDLRDSDAQVLSASGAPFDGFWGTSTGTLGQPGDNNHAFDFGVVLGPLPVYDLALRKRVSGATVVDLGDSVTFNITLFNQGTATANVVEIIDYVDLLAWEPFSVALNPPGIVGGFTYSWTADGTNGRLTITGVLAASESVTVPVTLVVAPTAVGTLSNFAEIDVDDGDDSDSIPDGDEGNGNNDPLIDDEVDNGGGDQDDHDVAVVTLVGLYPIPTLGTWGLFLLVGLLLVVSLRFLGRRQSLNR